MSGSTAALGVSPITAAVVVGCCSLAALCAASHSIFLHLFVKAAAPAGLEELTL